MGRAGRATPRDGAPTSEPGGVQSVDRAITVLEVLARSGDGVGVSEVAVEIGVHKSTAFRLLTALERRDMVEQDGERGKYRLGVGVLRLASAASGSLDLVRQARPILVALAATVGETVNLAVMRGRYAVNVDDVRGPGSVTSYNWTGRLTPLHATSSGKVLLAYADEPVRSALLDTGLEAFTDRTLTRRGAVQDELRAVVERGYATALEEYELGLHAVAVPVRDHTGTVAAALSVSGPAYRLDTERIEMILDDVRAAGRQASRRMGHLG